jgi:hypothetical protein
MNTQRVATANPTGQVAFSGHETFVCRYGWLKKAVDAVCRNRHAFVADSAMVELGVGKNMVRSIRHWALATKVIEELPGTRGAELRVSDLGELLFAEGGRDPYREDPNTLWVLHWQLANNERRATTWTWAFSLLRSQEFSRDTILGLVQGELRRRSIALPSEHSLRRDIDIFVRTYVAGKQAVVLEDSLDCPLTELGLLAEDETGVLTFQHGFHRTLAMPVFAYTLLDFWQRTAADRETLPFSDLAYGSGSPGLTLKLDENSLMERLEHLDSATAGHLVYTDTAGIRQVYRRGNPIPAMEVLSSYYEHAAHGMLMES